VAWRGVAWPFLTYLTDAYLREELTLSSLDYYE
jgi:hypothetical protein